MLRLSLPREKNSPLVGNSISDIKLFVFRPCTFLQLPFKKIVAPRGQEDMVYGMGFGLFSRSHPKRYGISHGPVGYLIQTLCNDEFFPINILKSLMKDEKL